MRAERSGGTYDRLRTFGRMAAQPTGSLSTERVRMLWRIGPLWTKHRTIDTSVLRADGRLIRSDRLARLEAALFLTRSASAVRLARLARLVDAQEARQLIERLNESYDRTRSAFRVERTAGGYQLLTRSALAGWLDRLHHRQDRMRLSQPALETLTIIAYLQPVTRADVEAVRGVQCTDLIRQLIDRGLIRVAGEDDSLGRPFLYATTRAFLDMFGLGRPEDLPDYDRLRRSVRPTDAPGHASGEPASDENTPDPDPDVSDSTSAASDGAVPDDVVPDREETDPAGRAQTGSADALSSSGSNDSEAAA